MPAEEYFRSEDGEECVIESPVCPRCPDGQVVRVHHVATAAIPECWTWRCEVCEWETQPE